GGATRRLLHLKILPRNLPSERRAANGTNEDRRDVVTVEKRNARTAARNSATAHPQPCPGNAGWPCLPGRHRCNSDKRIVRDAAPAVVPARIELLRPYEAGGIDYCAANGQPRERRRPCRGNVLIDRRIRADSQRTRA